MSDVEPGDGNPYALEEGEPGVVARLRDWILLDGDRLVLAAMLSAAIFVLFLGLNALDVIAFTNDNSITRAASGMVAGTFSLVTLVVSINQLILSREFSAVSEARERLEGVMDLRREVEAAAEVPASPTAPARLLELLLETIHARAGTLAESVEGQEDEEVREAVGEYADYVRESTDRIDRRIDGARSDTFEALSASVRYDDAWQFYLARRLRNRHEEELNRGSIEAFDDLVEAVERFGVAREQFKTTYLQRELTRFSQLTILCGVPAILSALLIGFLYADVGGPAIAVDRLPVVVCALLTVIVSPLALMASYILRTATITRRTASTGPMLPGKEFRDRPFERRDGEE
ncbi:hypothetical protein [Saliphagus sp. LR7]|uniref:hypothetical protein n=1 Tax=Saliphagus sp. LR7 TaxID=2282654 RepID=UPI000DF72EDC|nr:hypothetical protein [Saliphagus sp. LR7]